MVDTISALSGNKTILVIAHRTTTVKRYDTVFFLKNGKLIDSGTFAKLIAQSAELREMVGHIPEDVASPDSSSASGT